MGVIVKYLIDFTEAGVKVSNNVLTGGFLLDAEVTAEMVRGTAGSTFEIHLIDLPEKKAAALHENKHVTIKLGYSDLGPFDTVMTGVIESVGELIQVDKLVTVVKGIETATFVLQKGSYKYSTTAAKPIKDVIKELIQGMTPPSGEKVPDVSIDDKISASLTSPVTFKGDNLLPLLQRLADQAQAQLYVGDGKIFVGKPIKRTDRPLTPLRRDKNLAVFQSFKKKLPTESNSNLLLLAPEGVATGFIFTIAGDPALRPGHQVSADLTGFDKDDFRIHSIQHHLTMTDGYTCKGQANLTTDSPTDSRADAHPQQATPEGLVTGISTLVTAAAASAPPVIEIGQVKEYVASSGTGGHTATLFYGQKAERTETQPSVATEVQNEDQQVATTRPLISPFAFNKCGLIVPVYKGMKAVMAHNRALDQDSIVMGYIWSTKPAISPPANQAGDWWLCLPADYTDSSPPDDSTKSTNDLTANNGKRVIQVKGLKITVGADLLTAVGKRPDTGEDDEFLIQHKKASIKIAADGSLEIMADAQGQKGKITIASSGDIEMTATGSVKLKVGASGVEIS